MNGMEWNGMECTDHFLHQLQNKQPTSNEEKGKEMNTKKKDTNTERA
jgi:hypothetical protein